VGQGNLTKPFLDPHLQDTSFDPEIVLVLVCGESDVLEILQHTTDAQIRYHLMLFVSHVRRGSCGRCNPEVAPRFDFGRIRT
jgi:hypothetical protein